MLNVVLVAPEIPQNTGNIARSALALGLKLHIVKPCGFSLETAAVKRAGVDYWKYVDITTWEDLDEFLASNDTGKMHFFSKRGKVRYDSAAYRHGDFLVFGCESAGLPANILEKYGDRSRYLPISDTRIRSLNLASAATAAMYEAMRQLDFKEV
ncbi:tRNA (cytidine(34)-2'-O)-methyltransferase [bacterium]|nr:tRNA (cytidine(34)-2'-O)-methyltransferase [bacterium]